MSINLPARKLVSQQDASLVQMPNVPRSRFTGSWTHKTSFDAGYLIPFMVEEVYPGDQISYSVTAYVRMATPLFPLFDNQRVDTFFFFTPCRLLWDNWHKMMGEQDHPSDSTQYLIPQVKPADLLGKGFLPLGIADHMGIPPAGQIDPVNGIETWVNALPFRAYNRIFHEWFRDQNSDTVIVELKTDDGIDLETYYGVRRRMKSHDYFTSALPWPQKGTSPSIPITGKAYVKGIGFNNAGVLTTPGAGTPVREPGTIGTTTFPYLTGSSYPSPNNFYLRSLDQQTLDVYADLTAATAAITVNALRQAFAIQTLLERDARGGTRLSESIFMQFGVRSPDARLQRPEYIGGGSTALNLTPIAQTAPTDGEPLGALGAAGTAVGQHTASVAATEHGYVLGIINVRSELSYQQGLHKMWSRKTRYDFMYPATAGLGEQAILMKELYYRGISAEDETVFGYQERWQELRTRTSEVTAGMRSTNGMGLDPWHLSQRFTAPPTLSAQFLEDNPPMARVLAAGELAIHQQYLADILIQRNLTRALPTYGTPSNLGRF